VNIVRIASSLTAASTKKDPAFEGFRKSGNWMKEASPIAALYWDRTSFRRKSYSGMIKSTSSPPFSGLDLDLQARTKEKDKPKKK
jgi:hypothetical protein